MLPDVDILTAALLRNWPLPAEDGSKYSRGNILVVGGSAGAPGAAALAGTAALRAGAGRLTLAVAREVTAALGVAVPEAGVLPLPPVGARRGASTGEDDEPLGERMAGADAIVLGPGLDDIDQTTQLLGLLRRRANAEALIVLDAYALGALAADPALAEQWQGRLVLTPNEAEAARLLDESLPIARAVPRIAERFGAVVTSFGIVAAPDGHCWELEAARAGLGTSGSGDVLAGLIAGVGARGAAADQAACWATYLHVLAGRRLVRNEQVAGYLARELPGQVPAIMAELTES